MRLSVLVCLVDVLEENIFDDLNKFILLSHLFSVINCLFYIIFEMKLNNCTEDCGGVACFKMHNVSVLYFMLLCPLVFLFQ